MARGGTGKGPSPLLYFLMGIGFGIGGQTVRSARELGFRLDGFELDVATAYDARGKLMLGDLYVGQLWYKYRLNLQSAESAARARQLLDHVETHCRTLDLVSRPARLVPHLVVNGREVDYSLPPQPSPDVVRAEWGLDVDESAFWYSFPAPPPTELGRGTHGG